jgi:hypothetical protein
VQIGIHSAKILPTNPNAAAALPERESLGMIDSSDPSRFFDVASLALGGAMLVPPVFSWRSHPYSSNVPIISNLQTNSRKTKLALLAPIPDRFPICGKVFPIFTDQKAQRE